MTVLSTKVRYCMDWVCTRYNVRSYWLILEHYFRIIPMGRLRACNTNTKKHNKQFINLEQSLFKGKSQTLALS